MSYDKEFQKQAVEKALVNGLKPTAREMKIARNTLRRWIRNFTKEQEEKQLELSLRRIDSQLTSLVVQLKEKKPESTLKSIQEEIKKQEGKILSLESIRTILIKYGMSNNVLPLRGPHISEIEGTLKDVSRLINEGNLVEAANIINSIPAFPVTSDITVLMKIPPELLTLRRRVEQLALMVDTCSRMEILKRAKFLRMKCEEKHLYFSACFVSAIEINALNFLGLSKRVVSLYKKYSRFIPYLPPSLKYLLLSEYYITYSRDPALFPDDAFKYFLRNFEHFCSKLPPGTHRIFWFYRLSGCYELCSNINKASFWSERLLNEKPLGSEVKYFSQYLPLLALKGEYSKILNFNIPAVSVQSKIASLRLALAHANALLFMGYPKEALDLILGSFYEAQREHLIPLLSKFMFFLSYCYAALNENKKSYHYLRRANYYAKDYKSKALYTALLNLESNQSLIHSGRGEIKVAYFYLKACETRRLKNYLRTYNYAQKRGLLGFLHRIVLLHPEMIWKLLRVRKDTKLPYNILQLPIFQGRRPNFNIFLLRKQEAIFYGDKKLKLRPKDFHLVIFFFLHRKKWIEKEQIFNIFFKNTLSPTRCLTKALSRIRTTLGIDKETLISRPVGKIYLDIDAKIDLEVFEEHFKIGRIYEKAGEEENAIKEYQQCFMLYKKSPFEQIGYYYNFAEERRNIARNMYREICYALLKNAKKARNHKLANKIKDRLKQENLLLNLDEYDRYE